MAVRFATRQDIPQILAIYTPYVLETAASFEYTPPTLEAFTARFDAITAQFPWLVWEENGQVLGYAYGSLPFTRTAYQWCAECSVYLMPEAQGRGIGRKLYAALEECLTAQGYHKVYAIITSQNENSLAFHRAVGYTQVAQMPDCGFKFGKWYGITWMEKQLIGDKFPGEAPKSVDFLVKNDRNFQ